MIIRFMDINREENLDKLYNAVKFHNDNTEYPLDQIDLVHQVFTVEYSRPPPSDKEEICKELMSNIRKICTEILEKYEVKRVAHQVFKLEPLGEDSRIKVFKQIDGITFADDRVFQGLNLLSKLVKTGMMPTLERFTADYEDLTNSFENWGKYKMECTKMLIEISTFMRNSSENDTTDKIYYEETADITLKCIDTIVNKYAPSDHVEGKDECIDLFQKHLQQQIVDPDLCID